MDNLKLDAIGPRKCTLFRIVTNMDKDGRDHSAWAAVSRVEPTIKV